MAYLRALAGALLLLGLASAARADRLDDYIGEQMRLSHVPGVAVAIVRDGKVEAIRSYGRADLEWDAPVGPDTRFQLASATKLFTGVALMRLVERGAIGLDDPITKHLPDAPEAWRAITIHHLATHMSGLPENLGEHPDSVAGVVAAAQKLPLAYAPGTRSQYGFTDFTVLRAILEKISGKSLPDLYRDEIFAPAGLKDSGFDFARQEGPIRSARPLPRRASIYAWKEGEQRRSDYLYGETGYGAGGLYSSARDMAAFFAALDSGKLLKPESFRLLQQAPLLADGKPAGFGVGWTARRYRGVPVVGHSGGPALADVLRIDDRKLTVIVLTNQQRLLPLLAEGIVDFHLPAPPAPVGIADPQPALTATMRAAFAGAAAGKVDQARFGEGGRQRSLPFLTDFGAVLLGAVGPVERVTLLEDATAGAGRERRYAIQFERKLMYWRLVTDAQGRIEDMHPVSER